MVWGEKLNAKENNYNFSLLDLNQIVDYKTNKESKIIELKIYSVQLLAFTYF